MKKFRLHVWAAKFWWFTHTQIEREYLIFMGFIWVLYLAIGTGTAVELLIEIRRPDG